jgi:DnaJ-class molecular chaperone
MASVAEIKCEACNGTGFPKVAQPAAPGKRIYPAPCKQCRGKGRIRIVRDAASSSLDDD